MRETRSAMCVNTAPSCGSRATMDDDKIVMSKIRSIIDRGNNAEIKKAKDGSLSVMEVKKHIV